MSGRVGVVSPDHDERLHWLDPTADEALSTSRHWPNVVAMVEYLLSTYSAGVVRDEAGRIQDNLERPIKHGTRGGYLAHLRRKIPPCRDCSDANTADFRRRRSRHRTDRTFRDSYR